MVEQFDFFPFDMDPGAGFSVVFLILSVTLMRLGTMVRNAIARKLDQGPKPPLVAPSTPTEGHPAPAPGEPNPPLAVGVLPRVEQLWLVAWLRAGKVGVAQTLVVNAWAEGWLSSSPRNRTVLRFTGREAPRDRVAAMFYARLEQTQGRNLSREDVYGAAAAVAVSMGPELRREAKRAGMVRSNFGEWLLALVMLFFGALAEAVAVIRLVVCQALSPDAPSPEPVVLDILAMVVVGTVSILLAKFRPVSHERKRYLEWLEDATLSLVCDVDTGRSQQPADVTLAAAVAGLSIIRPPREIGLFPQIPEVERVESYEPPSSYTSMGP